MSTNISLPWMQIFIGDELAETAHLSAEEYGSHMRLRLHQWQHGELPQEDERLRRICLVDREQWPSIRDALAPLFDLQWHHARTADVRRASEMKREKMSENGRKGGRPRSSEKPTESQLKAIAKANGKADGKPNETPSPSPSPSPLQSDSQSQSASDRWALEEEEGYASTPARDDGPQDPFEPQATLEQGKLFLMKLGVPANRMETALQRLMRGALFPCDVEEWRLEPDAARGAA